VKMAYITIGVPYLLLAVMIVVIGLGDLNYQIRNRT